MTGPENVDLEDSEMQGVMPRAIGQVCFSWSCWHVVGQMALCTACLSLQVFRELKRRRLVEYKVGVTYIEIYNETFRDLLCPETKSSDIGVSEKRYLFVSRASGALP